MMVESTIYSIFLTMATWVETKVRLKAFITEFEICRAKKKHVDCSDSSEAVAV